jgi:hypothetical protein
LQRLANFQHDSFDQCGDFWSGRQFGERRDCGVYRVVVNK